jgi:hypothetical protein
METEYLKHSVGDMLAKGIAQVIEQQPQDPIEYLGLWLLHQIQLREVQMKRSDKNQQYEQEKKQFLNQDSKQKEQAAITINTNIRAYLQRKEESSKKQLEEEAALQRAEEELRQSMYIVSA